VTLFRCFRWRRDARASERGGALWFPREVQGDGRHDAPNLYGCLYVSEVAVSAVVEQLARLRGTSIDQADFRIGEDRISLATIELEAGTSLIDLDDPGTLVREHQRPSGIATRARATTQALATKLYEAHLGAAGIRWWSTFEASWINVTLWDRAIRRLEISRVEPLGVEHATVVDAAHFLELPAPPAPASRR
jgi:hypothetical protein